MIVYLVMYSWAGEPPEILEAYSCLHHAEKKVHTLTLEDDGCYYWVKDLEVK